MKAKKEFVFEILKIYRMNEIDFTIDWRDEPEFDDVRDEIEAKLLEKIFFVKEENNWLVVNETSSVFCENLDKVFDTIYFMIEEAYTDVYGACAGDCFDTVDDLTFNIINITGNSITLK